MTPEVNCTGGTSDGRFIFDICPEVAEFGPVNRSIHKVNEAVALAEIEPLAEVYRLDDRGAARRVKRSASRARPRRCARCSSYGVARFEAAQLSYGHGTANALDEAAWLILARAGLPLDELEAHLDAPLTEAHFRAAAALLDRRVRTRKPAAYLLHEAWLGPHRFYVDERVIVPRSFIAELLLAQARARGPSRRGRSSTCAPAPAASRSSPRSKFPDARVDAADLSQDALEVARRNVAAYGLEDRVQLVRSDLFGALRGRDLRPHRREPALRDRGRDAQACRPNIAASPRWRSRAAPTASSTRARSSPRRART